MVSNIAGWRLPGLKHLKLISSCWNVSKYDAYDAFEEHLYASIIIVLHCII